MRKFRSAPAGIGGRRVGLMSEAAPGRFNALSADEIAALYAYLQARVAAQ